MKKYSLVCSAVTKEDLEKMINQYFYSKNYVITDDNMVYNTLKDEVLDSYAVVNKKGRWRFELINER